YLVPIAFLAMMASMLFDFEVAAVSTLVTVLLVAIYTSFGLPFVLVSVVAGIVAAHSVRQVRHREDFYLSGIRVVAAYAGAIFVADLWDAAVSATTLTKCGWGGLNAIVSMGIVVVTLPLFERGFRVTTNITLLELADMNKPLLRKMAMASPGTYHHSIVVGNLAEAAAKAINANGLLARVASYYHDIGKLVAPGYFVENQQGIDPEDSKHTALKPKVSSLVIRAHVKDGVELAEKEGLPQPLIDIIREHHGTGVMEFFYNKALETAEDPGEVNKGDYSYPGPRPRSKESAIIALADTIEARVRSVGDAVTPRRIEAEIAEVIEKRWHDHQLDAAELTLSDLTKIREAFFRVLAGMYHQRVRYPDQESTPEGARPRSAADGKTPRAASDGATPMAAPDGKTPKDTSEGGKPPGKPRTN
ncbi:MAG: HDIG domain-containing protein, partial [Candidatus Eisenbacteria bacterium]|nr:HDIG domain-containing protein [Candidatus Eisenbacteria bacterium]